MSKKTEIPPTEDKRPEISAPSEVAGGLPSIFSSMKHAVGEMGLILGNK